MRGPFNTFKCDLNVGTYLRSIDSVSKNCIDQHLRLIKNGSVEIDSTNDISNPNMYYYIECNHYILISVSISPRSYNNKKALVLEIKRYP